ncbi:MAG: hypothetical protein M3314_13960 [Actinomycetota bacterium]|nr:hypothetical protein [Actinomycetota bacterium]
MQLYLTYCDDQSTLADRLRREFLRLDPNVEVIDGTIRSGATPAKVPARATVLMLVGPTWAGVVNRGSDPQRRFLEASFRGGRRIVPVLFQVPLQAWGPICEGLPETLAGLAVLNAFELRDHNFSADAQVLLDKLRASTDSPWTENEGRTVIRIDGERGGPFKFYANRQPLLVFVDGNEVGAVMAWNGHFECTVEPGRHTVQVRQPGHWAPKSEPLAVDVKRGATASLVCERRITGGLSLNPRK